MHTIRIDDSLSVVVSFTVIPVEQLTDKGFQQTEGVVCTIDNARGLIHLGSGESLRSQDDVFDKSKGYRVALERAAQNAFPYNREARTILHAALWFALNEEQFDAERHAVEEHAVHLRIYEHYRNQLATDLGF